MTTFKKDIKTILQKKCFVLLISILILGGFHAQTAITTSSTTTFETTDALLTINCQNTTGTITPFCEMNSGPLPIYYVEKGTGITKQYQQTGISMIRTHDFYGPTDVSTIFPNWSADPTCSSSYNFTSSDYYINGIVNAGCNVFYRLGESASDNNSLRQPPQNFTKWALICKHIIMHYNDGWNNGYHHNITYWEIWNEPDLTGFWNGTAEQYYQLYETTVSTLKAYNGSLLIGGPCTSSVYNENYTTGFLTYLKENHLPLDFYSWHMYADTPNMLFEASKQVRTMLDTFGFISTENINTEWNINILSPQRDKDNAKNAAFTACILTAFQDAGINHAFRYRGTQDDNWLMKLLGFDLSLFTANGTYKTPALSYLAINYMTKETPLKLKTPIMNASDGITVLAGISKDRTNISILVSNFNSGDRSYCLNLTNLPWDDHYTLHHYLIDDTHHFEKIKSQNQTASQLTFNLRQNSVHFFRLTNTTYYPADGPPTVPIPLILQLHFLDPILRMLGIIILSIIFG